MLTKKFICASISHRVGFPLAEESRVNIYQKLSVALALSLYLPLSYQILTGKVRQNLATFILWGSLDAIAALSIFAQGGNYYLPAIYVAGCSIVVSSILKSKSYGVWTSYETKIVFLVALSVVAWFLSGPWAATIFSTSGVMMASLPQIKDTWRDPASTPGLIYAGCTVANALSIVGGSAWTVEERLFPTACTVLCIFIVVLTLRGRQRRSGAIAV